LVLASQLETAMQVLSTGSDARAHLPAHGRDHRIDLHTS
jgi:hypothetical protein